MKNLQIDEKKAKELYKTASAEFKQMLEDTFGKEYFQERIQDRVKTFEDACAVLGISTTAGFSSEDTVDERAYKKLKIIAKALNGDWKPNYCDKEQPKYYPYFKYENGTFSYNSWAAYYYGSSVGARLSYKSAKLAEYAAKQFIDIYNDFLKP